VRRASIATAVAFFLSGVLAGCSTHPSEALPGTIAVNQSKRGTATLHIRIPKHAKPARVRVVRHGKPRYVSAATQGMTIALTGPTALTETVGLIAGSTGCTSSATDVACSLSLSLAPGAYTATISTYDAITCSGSPQVCTIPGSADQLSTAQAVAFSIVAGQTNPIGLTLSGIPAQLIAVPGSVFSATGASGDLHLVGLGPHAILAEALDAGSNIIVGAGAPTFSMTQSGSLTLGISTPAPNAPNRFLLTPPATYTQNTASLQLTANYTGQPTDGCAQPNAVCTTNVTASMVQMLAVINGDGGSSVAGFISLFALGDSSPFITMTNDIPPAPSSVVADKAGDLFVGQDDHAAVTPTNGSVLVFQAGSATVGCCVNGITSPVTAVTIDKDQHLYVAEMGSSLQIPTVLEYLPGAATPFRTLTGHKNAQVGITAPVALATDDNDRLYVLNAVSASDASLAEYDSNQSDPLATSPTGFSGPSSVAVASGATPIGYVADTVGQTLYSYVYGGASPPGENTCVNGAPSPESVIVDSANNVYAGNAPKGPIGGCSYVGNTVSEWSASSPFPSSPTTTWQTGISDPVALALDNAGDLIVANRGNSTIEIFPAGSTTPSLTIADGVDVPLAIAVVP
jgi:hypothetical protein